MDAKKLVQQLITHEGLRLKPYRDTVGKLTLGVGRNLDDRGITEEEAMVMLGTDLAQALEDARVLFPAFDGLGDARQRVLVDMAFNLGRSRLAKFVKMAAAIEARDWDLAADEMLDSLWATQVGARAQRLAAMMRQGHD